MVKASKSSATHTHIHKTKYIEACLRYGKSVSEDCRRQLSQSRGDYGSSKYDNIALECTLALIEIKRSSCRWWDMYEKKSVKIIWKERERSKSA